MNYHYVDAASYAAWRNEAGPGVFAFGMWLRAGFIGASAVAVGLLQMFGGDVKPLAALALTAGGVLLAAFSWWRARKALDGLDEGGAAVGVGRTPQTRVVTS